MFPVIPSFRLSIQNVLCIFFSTLQDTLSAYLIYVDVLILIIFNEEDKL